MKMIKVKYLFCYFIFRKKKFLTKEYFITGYYDDIAVSQEEILKTAQSFKKDPSTQNIDP